MEEIDRKLTTGDKIQNLFSPKGQQVKGYCSNCRRIVLNEKTAWADEGICIYCWDMRKKTLEKVKEQLAEDLGNGNLEHTFNKEYVDNNRFVKNFLRCVKERIQGL